MIFEAINTIGGFQHSNGGTYARVTQHLVVVGPHFPELAL